MTAQGVSVVIPAFNAARTLGATLDSVAGQRRPPLEVIVVDDGSSDDTAALALAFTDRLPALQVIGKPNGGVARARNRGMAAARGDLVAPLDADDVWHPDYLLEMERPHREKPETGMSYSFLSRIDAEGRLLLPHSAYAANGWAFHRLLAVNFICCGSNTVLNRKLLLAAGGYDESLRTADDTLMQWQMAARAPIACVPKCLTGYRDWPGSMSRNRRAQAEHQLVMTEKLLRGIPGIDRRMARTALAFAHKHLATEFASNEAGSRLEILGHWAKAFLLDPGYTWRALAYYRESLAWLAKEARRKRDQPETVVPRPFYNDVPPDPPDVVPPAKHELRLLEKAFRLDSELTGPLVGEGAGR